MKLYYHPASTTSRIVMLFAAEEKVDLEYQVVDLFTGEHMKPPYADNQSELPRADARGRRLPPHRELGDPQVPGREGRLARLSEGPAQRARRSTR